MSCKAKLWDAFKDRLLWQQSPTWFPLPNCLWQQEIFMDMGCYCYVPTICCSAKTKYRLCSTKKKKKDRNDSSWGGTPETNGKEKLIFSGKFGDPTWNVSRELFAFAGLSNFSFHFLSWASKLQMWVIKHPGSHHIPRNSLSLTPPLRSWTNAHGHYP